MKNIKNIHNAVLDLQLIKKSCNFILSILPPSKSIFSILFQPILDLCLILVIKYCVPLFIGTFIQNLSIKTWKMSKNLIFSDFWELYPVSLFWTNNNFLLSQTKFISSKHTCSPTTSVNIRISPLSVLYLWPHKIGKNRIFWKKNIYIAKF